MVISSEFTIDTKSPQIEVLLPSDGDNASSGGSIMVEWSAQDDSFGPTPIIIFLSTELGNFYETVIENTVNDGQAIINPLPAVDTYYGSIKTKATDEYGNYMEAYSLGYFTIGNPGGGEDQEYTEYSVEFEVYSSEFVIDTSPPMIEWIFPEGISSYTPNQEINVQWNAQDDNLEESSINIYLTINQGAQSIPLLENIVNNGDAIITIPDISAENCLFKIDCMDQFGYSTLAQSLTYFSIGDVEVTEYEDIFIEFEVLSSAFIIDTDPPDFLPINEEGDMLIPNGGEQLLDYEEATLGWNVGDESSENGYVDIGVSYLLGGWFTSVGQFGYDSLTEPIDLSLDNQIAPSLWSLIRFTAFDDYGNTQDATTADYFVLGDPEGTLDATQLSTGQIVLDWGWQENHLISITGDALSFMETGDILSIVDEQGIHNTICGDSEGLIVLDSYTYTGTDADTLVSLMLNAGVDYCDLEGERVEGYNTGNPISYYFTDISQDVQYELHPVSAIGPDIFANEITIVSSFDFDPSLSSQHILSSENNRANYNTYNVYKGNSERDTTWTLIAGEVTNPYIYIEPEDLMDGIDFSSLESNFLCYKVNLLAEHTLAGGGFELVETDIDTEMECSHVGCSDITASNYDPDADLNCDNCCLYGEDLVDLTIPIISGWNWFSINAETDDMSLNTLLSTLGENGIFIKSQTAFSDYYSGWGWFGTLGDLDVKQMYMLNSSSSSTISFTGIPSDLNTTIDLSPGWNWIGYIPQDVMDIGTALGSIENGVFIKNQTGFADYYEGWGWFGTLTTMEPNIGYMINMDGIDQLVYPSESFLDFSTPYELVRTEDIWEINPYDFEFSGTMTIQLNEGNYILGSEDDLVGAFIDDEIFGVTHGLKVPFTDEIVFPLMVYSNGNQVSEISFKYFDFENNEIIDLDKKINFEADMMLGNALDPVIMKNINIPEKFALHPAYPNPFNPVVNISYDLPEDAFVTLTIFNILGQEIYTIENNVLKQAGYYSLTWNAISHMGLQVSSGVYFYTIKAGSFTASEKMICLK